MHKFILLLSILIFSLSAQEKKINYLGDEYSGSEYKAAKKEEMDKLKKDVLKLSCKVKFTYTNTKYFNIAYRSSVQQMKVLLNLMEVFYKTVYPKYFDTDPNFSFRIVIFKSQKEFTKCTNTPPGLLGYYFPYGDSFQSNTLFTYSNSGYGTYWHEIMHGFIDANTDIKPPDWFNEGLASFYEMAPYEEGKIIEGYTNWRHPYLLDALKKDKFIPLKLLLAQKSDKSALAESEYRFLFLYLYKKKVMESFSKKYLLEILPGFKDQELTSKTIELLERETGLTIQQIEDEIKSLASKLEPDEKVKQD